MTLQEYLYSMTKEELVNMADFFMLDVPPTARKKFAVDSLAEMYEMDTSRWLSLLTERDYQILDTLVKAGPDKPVKFPYTELYSFLEFIRIVDEDDTDRNNVTLSLPEPFYNIIGPVYKDIWKAKIDSGGIYIENLAYGILNTYGILKIKDFVEIILSFFDDENINQERLADAIGSLPFMRTSRYNVDRTVYVCSPFLQDVKRILKDRKRFRKGCTKYKVYTPAEYIKAGQNVPFCSWGRDSREYQDSVAVLKSLGYDDSAIMSIMHTVWEEAQFSEDEEATDCMFDSISKMMDSIPSFEQYRSYIETIAAYANSIPKWILKGHTSNEIDALKVNVRVEDNSDTLDVPDYDVPDFLEAPQTEKAPSVQKMPDEFSDFYKYSMAVSPAISPDSPCPCGSGRPYRLCHGRHMN